MEYGIIEEMADLAFAPGQVDAKLKKAARLFAEAFPFDHASIYEWDAGGRRFLLKAWAGEGEPKGEYAEAEGIPGAAVKALSCIEEQGGEDTSTRWAGDAGLAGFSHAMTCPLRDRESLYGVLYLKSRSAVEVSEAQKAVIAAVAAQTVVLIKSGGLLASQQRLFKELKELKEKLQSAEKVTALGDMAATLAHEIRNPLISIGGFAARLKKRLPDGSPDTVYVEMMEREIFRLEKTINGITGFIKDNALELKEDDLNHILSEALSLFAEDLRERRITLETDLHPGPLTLLADREQLKIAFDNLIANAIQSMEKGGGTLKLSTKRSEEAVSAEVKDSGGGIDPANLGSIFNPFFTTKKGGTGLGLPITNAIVIKHKGLIEVDNEAGVGVRFTLKFPSAAVSKRMVCGE